ncbi:MAG: sulfatase family protein [Pirellulales bacterium]
MKSLTDMNRLIFAVCCLVLTVGSSFASAANRPNIVLVMADDQGWGQVGYYNHPILKTPHLDAMADSGLRLDRFYAAAPVCSPTRASVLTGRTNNRGGVIQHGYALHLQEKTISQALKKAGYTTGHFGKWHLDGLRGPGAPVLKDDPYHPGNFGFDEWLTVTNFFDMNPIMSRKGEFEEFQGDSSEIVIDEALKFIGKQAKAGQPSFTVIWYGSPHSPFVASDKDQVGKKADHAAHHYGELVAMDRSIGTLRAGLREIGIADNTLVWFNSDNGGLAKEFGPETVAGLRGSKGTIWEGGLRVPCVIEWPAGIKPRISKYPASTMDIMPTLVDLLGLPSNSMLEVVDGMSIAPLFKKELGRRKKFIPFQYMGNAAIVDNEYKIVSEKNGKGKYLLFNLDKDHTESNNLFDKQPEVAARLQKQLDAFTTSVAASQTGADYPEGKVTKEGPHGRFWAATPEYAPYIKELLKRPEYQSQKKKTSAKQVLAE